MLTQMSWNSLKFFEIASEFDGADKVKDGLSALFTGSQNVDWEFPKKHSKYHIVDNIVVFSKYNDFMECQLKWQACFITQWIIKAWMD